MSKVPSLSRPFIHDLTCMRKTHLHLHVVADASSTRSFLHLATSFLCSTSYITALRASQQTRLHTASCSSLAYSASPASYCLARLNPSTIFDPKRLTLLTPKAAYPPGTSFEFGDPTWRLQASPQACPQSVILGTLAIACQNHY